MSLAAERASARRQSFFRITFSALLLLSSCLAVFAQGVGSSRGLPSSAGSINSIQGHIYFPATPQEGTRVKVTLSSTDMMNQSAVADEDGTFRFNGLPAGHYTLTVDAGREFDQAVEPVAIDREASGGGRTMQVIINLKLKGTADAFAKIPKAARDLYAKGMEAASKGDSKKAAEQLGSAVSLYPSFPQALSELGVQYLKLGQADKAAESLEAALKIAPGDLNARLAYGIALLNLKKFDEAETQLREVLKKNDAMPTGHMYLGITLMNLKKLDEAETELRRAVSMKSNEVGIAHRYLGGIYWGKRDYKQAADELETYLRLFPKAADAERTRAAIKDLRSKQ
ncbi:MAG TPA: tetratricopeptide repeat protein [Pyrinomonadaceae bacterium]|jgi:tetratricopeptide (TPR) repeat protein